MHTPDALESRSPEQREHQLLQRLPALVARAKTTPGWGAILKDIDAEAVSSRAALAHLPLTRKSALKALQQMQPPFAGLLSGDVLNLRRNYMSPGPIFDPEGRASDWWRFSRPLRALGVQRGDLIHNCFSYHFTPAAFMIESGAETLGCRIVPAGTGQTDMQVEAIAALKPDVYTGTPSFLKIILERAHETGQSFSHLNRALVSAEALPPSLRTTLQQLGVPTVLQLYASADVGSIAYETLHEGQVNPGMVLDEDLLLEIVRPGTGEVVADGQVGEVVLTSFNPDYPLIRFATGDLSAILPGRSPCGRSNVRLKGWLGRADQTTKVRAMFVHPSHVAEIVKRHPAIRKARLIISGTISDEHMTLHCESAEALDTPAIIASIRDITKLRGEVRPVAPDSLPNDGIVIEDARSYV